MPFSGEWWVGLKVPSFLSWPGLLVTSLHPEAPQKLPHWNKGHSYHPGNSKGFKSSASDTPITQEITNALGALCWELGSKINAGKKDFSSTPIYKDF